MIKNLKQATKLLASFDFEGASYYDISIYLTSDEGRVLSIGTDSYREPQINKWGKSKWRDLISEVEWYNANASVVRSIQIAFDTAESNGIYQIEATDILSKAEFDKITYPGCPITESNIYGCNSVKDVLTISELIPKYARKEANTKLAEILLAG